MKGENYLPEGLKTPKVDLTPERNLEKFQGVKTQMKLEKLHHEWRETENQKKVCLPFSF